MPETEFFIAFTGTPARYAVFARFFDRLRVVKQALRSTAAADVGLSGVVRDPAWIELLDGETIESLTAPGAWSLEDILDCVLTGDYDLVSVTFDGSEGRLVYDPAGFPFGGTDSLNALVEAFGLEVVRDSFGDGFAEWYGRRD